MVSYVTSSIYSVSHSRHKSMIAPTDEIKKFQEKLGNGIDVNATNKEEYQVLEDPYESNKDNKRLKNQQERPQTPNDMAMKLALGEKLSKEEEDYLSDRYPKMKRYAEFVKEQGEELKKNLKNSKSEEESQKIILNAMENVSKQSQKGVISDFVVRMNMASIENAKNSIEKAGKIERFNNIKLDMQPGVLIDALA